MSKTKILLLLSLVITISAMMVMIPSRLGQELGAQLLQAEQTLSEAEIREKINPRGADAPESMDLIDDLNLYRELKTEEAIAERVLPYVKAEDMQRVAPYLNEIASYVHQILKNPKLNEDFFALLPMYPETNVATYGNILAYLFAGHENPMAFAVEQGLVDEGVRLNAYISPNQLIELLGNIFLEAGTNPYPVFVSQGVISSQGVWKAESTEGILLTDALRVILNVREMVERVQIQQAKLVYESQLIDLPNSAAIFDIDTALILLRAFALEVGLELSDQARNGIIAKFSPRFGILLKNDLVLEMRSTYQQFVGKTQEPHYLPFSVDLGDCFNELHRKLYVGAVTMTGPAGSALICDQVLIKLPANATIVNLFSLPLLTQLEGKNDRRSLTMMKSFALRSLKNTLVLGPHGEDRIKVVYRPNNYSGPRGRHFGFSISDLDDSELLKNTKAYSDLGAEMLFHPRLLNGDQFVSFDSNVK